MTTDELIEALERLEKEATPGPWEVEDRPTEIVLRWYDVDADDDGRTVDRGNEVCVLTDVMEALINAELVATLRNHLPALISALKENKRLRERPQAVLTWAVETFGPVADDAEERTFRFLEEAIELAHARGIQRADIDAVAGRVYSRPQGSVAREVGQCQLTLDALCAQAWIDGQAEADRELERVKSVTKEEWARRHAAKTALGITADARAAALQPQETPSHEQGAR